MDLHERAIEILKRRRDELVEDQILGVIVESSLAHCRHTLVSMLLKACDFETIISHLPYIPRDCFSGNRIPDKIILPDGIFKIEDRAFSLTGIEEIYIPKSVDSLGSSIFLGCDYLKKIDIPSKFEDQLENILYMSKNEIEENIEITFI